MFFFYYQFIFFIHISSFQVWRYPLFPRLGFTNKNNNEHKPIESLRNHDTDGNKNVTKNRFLLACEQASFWGIARDLT